MIRLTGGSKKGQSIRSIKKEGLRPTSSKVREALFNIIGPQLRGSRFLDLFAGTGSVGIEALSRGAAHVTFVEREAEIFRLLKENIERLEIGTESTLIRADAIKFLNRGVAFDLIYADPPYQAPVLEKLLPAVAGGDMITSNGLLIIEHFKKNHLPSAWGSLELTRRYPYGDSILSIYRPESGRSE